MNKSNDIFISHSSEDKKLGKALCQFLEERGFHCWIAPRDIRAGKDYGEAIIDAIQSSSIMIVVFSRFANESLHVRNEVERAFYHKLIIVPFRTEDIVTSRSFEYFLSSTHWLDASEGKPESYFEELYTICSSLLNNKPGEILTPTPVKSKPVQKRNPAIKIFSLITLIAFAGLLFFFFYSSKKKDSILSKADKSNIDSANVDRLVTNNTDHAAKDTTSQGKEKESIKEAEKTSKVQEKTSFASQKVSVAEKDDERPVPPETPVTSSLNSKKDLESINGGIYKAPTNTDNLMFTTLPNNRLDFSGTIGEYAVKGRLRGVNNKKFIVVGGEITGYLIFSREYQLITGNFIIKPGINPSFSLEKKN